MRARTQNTYQTLGFPTAMYLRMSTCPSIAVAYKRASSCIQEGLSDADTWSLENQVGTGGVVALRRKSPRESGEAECGQDGSRAEEKCLITSISTRESTYFESAARHLRCPRTPRAVPSLKVSLSASVRSPWGNFFFEILSLGGGQNR